MCKVGSIKQIKKQLGEIWTLADVYIIKELLLTSFRYDNGVMVIIF